MAGKGSTPRTAAAGGERMGDARRAARAVSGAAAGAPCRSYGASRTFSGGRFQEAPGPRPITPSTPAGGRRSVLKYLWASPATAVGLVAALAARASGARAAFADGVLEVAGGGIGRAIGCLPRALQFDAITLGHVVIATDKRTLAECRVHERVHVRQYERWGVLLFPLYVLSSVTQLLRGRDPYRHNYFERQAFLEERRR